MTQFIVTLADSLTNVQAIQFSSLLGSIDGKMSMVKEKGLLKHDASESHLSAMASWKDKESREAHNKEISELLSSDVLAKRRYYIQSIVDVILFLSENELAFRGTWQPESKSEDGLFNKLFEFSMQKDEKLK